MKKKLLVIVATLNLSACDTPNPFWQNVASKIESQGQVLLADTTDFDWDTVCVLSPYSRGSKTVEKWQSEYLPYELGEYRQNLPNLEDDNLWAFAFIKGDKVINIKRKGKKFTLRANYKNNCISKNNAKIIKDKVAPLGTQYLIITDN